MTSTDEDATADAVAVPDLLAAYLSKSPDDWEPRGPCVFLATGETAFVSFERESGELLALPYIHIESITLDGRGLGPLVLTFGKRKIELGGHELAGLYREFVARRVARVLERNTVTEHDIKSGLPIIRIIAM